MGTSACFVRVGSLLIALVLTQTLFGCANIRAAKTNRELIAAIKAAHTVCALPSQTASVDCYDEVERPIWERDDPDVLPIYLEFSAKRRALAQQFDAERSPPDIDYRIKAAALVARAKQLMPQLNDPRSPLLQAAHTADLACESIARPMTEIAKCLNQGERPAVERYAPTALSEYDEIATERQKDAEERDREVLALTPAAIERYKKGFQAAKEYFDLRLRDSRQAANAQALSDAADTAGEVLLGTVIVGAAVLGEYGEVKGGSGYVSPAPSNELHCVSRTMFGATYTDCR